MIINLNKKRYYFKWLDLYMEIIWSLFYSLMLGASWRWSLIALSLPVSQSLSLTLSLSHSLYIYIYISYVRAFWWHLLDAFDITVLLVITIFLEIDFEKEKFFMNSKKYWGKFRRGIILHGSYI